MLKWSRAHDCSDLSGIRHSGSESGQMFASAEQTVLAQLGARSASLSCYFVHRPTLSKRTEASSYKPGEFRTEKRQAPGNSEAGRLPLGNERLLSPDVKRGLSPEHTRELATELKQANREGPRGGWVGSGGIVLDFSSLDQRAFGGAGWGSFSRFLFRTAPELQRFNGWSTSQRLSN